MATRAKAATTKLTGLLCERLLLATFFEAF